MVRLTKAFVCQQCGSHHPKWTGRCDDCGAWNALVEETIQSTATTTFSPKLQSGTAVGFEALDGALSSIERLKTAIDEFDRVTGGGFVRGTALLIGGDPGIGKSTILLQAAAALAKRARCVYISGEESIDQLRLRAERLGVRTAPVALAAATSVRDIVTTLDAPDVADLVVIDSVQTLHLDTLDSAPGTVAQVRASAQTLIGLAKRRGFVLLLVGHVTKEGMIAGPRVLEHMVDTVLYFEGERGHPFRILRAVKNRFGATDEIGVFEMTDGGLRQVENPSSLFLADRERNVAGSCVFAGMEGTRPVLVEVQALVAPTSLATPRRAVVGWDSNRLAMILAVLEARCGLVLGAVDVFLNIAGGLRINEPAADLAVATALVSAVTGRPLIGDCVVFGEIGLGGEIRAVARSDARLREAKKLGFAKAMMPIRRNSAGASPIPLTEVEHLSQCVAIVREQKPVEHEQRRVKRV